MNILNFNDTITNDVASFEQPGPVVFISCAESVEIKFSGWQLWLTWPRSFARLILKKEKRK